MFPPWPCRPHRWDAPPELVERAEASPLKTILLVSPYTLAGMAIQQPSVSRQDSIALPVALGQSWVEPPEARLSTPCCERGKGRRRSTTVQYRIAAAAPLACCWLPAPTVAIHVPSAGTPNMRRFHGGSNEVWATGCPVVVAQRRLASAPTARLLPVHAGADHVHLRGGVAADGAQGAAAGVRPKPPGGAGAKVSGNRLHSVHPGSRMFIRMQSRPHHGA